MFINSNIALLRLPVTIQKKLLVKRNKLLEINQKRAYLNIAYLVYF
jgi:hypothetical protein